MTGRCGGGKFPTLAHRSFAAFLDVLEQAGELRRITAPVATELEITEIADREMKSPGGGKALLFERPTINGRPSRFPLAINTMGSERRMALALGIPSVDDLAHQMQLILKAKPPTSEPITAAPAVTTLESIAINYAIPLHQKCERGATDCAGNS